MGTSRRQFLKSASAAALLPMPAIAQGAGPKVVVIGGGFAGASAARFIKKANAATTVTLVEANPTFTACRFSNGVDAGLRPLPGWPLRAREPDRALPQDQEAEVEGHYSRRQGRILEAAPVPECVGPALSGSPRMGVAVEGRQGEFRRRRDKDAEDRLRRSQ